MLGSVAKLLSAAMAVLGPFIAGGLLGWARSELDALVLTMIGCCIGLIGLFLFAAIESGEVGRHRRALGEEGQ